MKINNVLLAGLLFFGTGVTFGEQFVYQEKDIQAHFDRAFRYFEIALNDCCCNDDRIKQLLQVQFDNIKNFKKDIEQSFIDGVLKV